MAWSMECSPTLVRLMSKATAPTPNLCPISCASVLTRRQEISDGGAAGAWERTLAA
jgi:hypothetical protein